MKKTTVTRIAFLNGEKTTARKAGRYWLVGGDFPQSGDKVTIAAKHSDWENGGRRWAWHTLKGCFLKFDDFMTDKEVNEQETLMRAGV